MSRSMNCAKICQKDVWFMVYFEFLSEITEIGLRISFKESGVKFTPWIKRFSPLAAQWCEKVLKFKQVMLGLKWGGKKHSKKTGMLISVYIEIICGYIIYVNICWCICICKSLSVYFNMYISVHMFVSVPISVNICQCVNTCSHVPIWVTWSIRLYLCS